MIHQVPAEDVVDAVQDQALDQDLVPVNEVTVRRLDLTDVVARGRLEMIAHLSNW